MSATVSVWNTQTGGHLYSLEALRSNVFFGCLQLLFSPDERFLFCLHPLLNFAKRWSVQTGEYIDKIFLGGFIDNPHNCIFAFKDYKNIMCVNWDASSRITVKTGNFLDIKPESWSFNVRPCSEGRKIVLDHRGNFAAIFSNTQVCKIVDMATGKDISQLNLEQCGFQLVSATFMHRYGDIPPSRIKQEQQERIHYLVDAPEHMPDAVQLHTGQSLIRIPRAFLLQ